MIKKYLDAMGLNFPFKKSLSEEGLSASSDKPDKDFLKRKSKAINANILINN